MTVLRDMAINKDTVAQFIKPNSDICKGIKDCNLRIQLSFWVCHGPHGHDTHRLRAQVFMAVLVLILIALSLPIRGPFLTSQPFFYCLISPPDDPAPSPRCLPGSQSAPPPRLFMTQGCRPFQQWDLCGYCSPPFLPTFPSHLRPILLLYHRHVASSKLPCRSHEDPCLRRRRSHGLGSRVPCCRGPVCT